MERLHAREKLAATESKLSKNIMQQRDISGYNGIYQRNKDLRRRDSALIGFKEVIEHALFTLFRIWQRMGRIGIACQY
jgi:hypothetical protein